MYPILVVLHVIISILLMLIVLIQSSKGSSLAGLVSSTSDMILSGGSGNVLLKRITIGVAVAFAVTSLLLTVVPSKSTRSVTDGIAVQQPVAQPAQQQQPGENPISVPSGNTVPAAPQQGNTAK
ncbi:MAG: preprotein translocase subunit SecG [Elusimicrobiota bacterium]